MDIIIHIQMKLLEKTEKITLYCTKYEISYAASGGSRNFERGGVSKRGPTPKIAKKSCIWGLKSPVLLTFDGKFWEKRGGACPLPPF
jgi:hypothetical protein